MVDSVIVQTATENKEDPKHVEEMIAKVDAAEAAVAAVEKPADGASSEEARPEWLPEKFKSPEDLAKAYTELEGKLGTKKPAEASTEGEPNTAEGDAAKAAAEAALDDKGLSFDAFSQEYAEKGELTAESYKKLEDAGIPKAIVDQFIAGQQAVAAKLQTEVKSVVGGDEGFEELVSWAADNASAEDIAAYNKAIDSGDIAQAKLAIAGLAQKFQEARPTEPNLLTGTNGKVSADAYESNAQLIADMAKPEYKNDPAFRNKVREKLARSGILSTS